MVIRPHFCLSRFCKKTLQSPKENFKNIFRLFWTKSMVSGIKQRVLSHIQCTINTFHIDENYVKKDFSKIPTITYSQKKISK